MAGLVAQAAEMLLHDRAVLALLRWHRRVGVAHCLQPPLHTHPTNANLRDALAFAHPCHRLAQRAIEALTLAVV